MKSSFNIYFSIFVAPFSHVCIDVNMGVLISTHRHAYACRHKAYINTHPRAHTQFFRVSFPHAWIHKKKHVHSHAHEGTLVFTEGRLQVPGWLPQTGTWEGRSELWPEVIRLARSRKRESINRRSLLVLSTCVCLSCSVCRLSSIRRDSWLKLLALLALSA